MVGYDPFKVQFGRPRSSEVDMVSICEYVVHQCTVIHLNVSHIIIHPNSTFEGDTLSWVRSNFGPFQEFLVLQGPLR